MSLTSRARSTTAPTAPAAARYLVNENRAGLAQIVGQVQASDRDSQPKRWAESRDLGQPGENHLAALLPLLPLHLSPAAPLGQLGGWTQSAPRAELALTPRDSPAPAPPLALPPAGALWEAAHRKHGRLLSAQLSKQSVDAVHPPQARALLFLLLPLLPLLPLFLLLLLRLEICGAPRVPSSVPPPCRGAGEEAPAGRAAPQRGQSRCHTSVGPWPAAGRRRTYVTVNH
jgi:hypothetical protein